MAVEANEAMTTFEVAKANAEQAHVAKLEKAKANAKAVAKY